MVPSAPTSSMHPCQVHGKFWRYFLRPTPFEFHRQSIIVVRALPRQRCTNPPSRLHPQNTAIAFVASHVNDTDQSNLVQEPRDPHEQQSLTTPIQLYPCLDALFPAKAQHDGLLDLGVGVTLLNYLGLPPAIGVYSTRYRRSISASVETRHDASRFSPEFHWWVKALQDS
jgi:hypothetical protein